MGSPTDVWRNPEGSGDPGASGPGERALSRREKLSAYLIITLFCGAVLLPVYNNWSDDPRDGFPLSYYPMFTSARGEQMRVSFLVGVDRWRRKHTLRYSLAGSGGFNQVRKQIRRAVREGRAYELAARVAARVARREGGIYPELVAVEAVTGTYRLDDYVNGRKKPRKLTLNGRASVVRSAP